MLNIKTEYNLLSSLIRLEDIITYAKKYNLDRLVIADTNMYGAMKFKDLCEKNNIKSVLGLNINSSFKINVYAKSYKGYQNMIKLSTIQNEREVEIEDLKKYNEDLICVLYFDSINSFNNLKDIFKEIYIGYSNKEELKKALLITNNVVFFRECLYLLNDDYKYLEYLYLIRDGKKISDEINYDLKEHNLIEDNIYDYTDRLGLNNIDKILDSCNIIFPKKENLLPIYKVDNIDSFTYLKSLSIKGLNKRLEGNVNETYQRRLMYELDVINKMGFVNYFLVVYDFIAYSKKNNILVGPGRGSAAGSLVAYSLGITEIDPIKYDLLFERFLNPERKTMPDIDTDFPDDKREEVINYVKEKYGESKISGIVTFGTLASKQVLRDTGRCLNIPIYKIDDLIEKMGNSKDDLKTIYKENINFRTTIESDDSLKKLFKIAIKIEGLKRHISQHPAGIIMSKVDINEIVPLTKNDNNYLASYESLYLEDMGLLKMDFLGLKNLRVISNIIDDINKYYNKNINFYKIPLDDKKVLDIFKNGDTVGIFQFESEGMKNFLMKLNPDTFEDIFAAIALYRPGPSMNIDTYIKRKKGLEKVEYIDMSLEPVLRNTYGIFIYQEQIIAAANIYAGYTLGEADILRRAMSKKKLELLQREEEKFIKKSIEKGHSEKDAKKLFSNILAFAGYGFNRSHSVAYSTIAYRLAYFKTYYKEIFYKNLLDNVIGDAKKTEEYIKEARSKDIKVVMPEINISTNKYELIDNTLYMPLSCIKEVGEIASTEIMKSRENNYKDIYEVIVALAKNNISKKTIESLILTGSFRKYNYNKKTLIENLDNLYNYAELSKDLDSNMLMKPEIEIKSEYSNNEELEKEKLLLGFYLTGHPVTKYLNDNKDIILLNSINKFITKNINTLVYVERIREVKTKNGDTMAFIEASDETSKLDFIAFPKVYERINIKQKDIIKVNGTVEKRLNKYQIIINNLIKLNGDKNEE